MAETQNKRSKRPEHYLTEKVKNDIIELISLLKNQRYDTIQEIPPLKREAGLFAIRKAHIANYAIITDTCEVIGICPATWCKWREVLPGFAEMEKEVKKHFINASEGQLHKNIKAGKELSLIFFLKNADPDNYRDRKELTLSNNWADIVKEVYDKTPK